MMTAGVNLTPPTPWVGRIERRKVSREFGSFLPVKHLRPARRPAGGFMAAHQSGASPAVP